eukprot:GFUD01004649.1.p1 GENE.GFUD01004649.1~~GFUD01004649.1.p1  ORF type:complete len:317 (+),score=49.52 GFUD01004649.1:130-951(+)
MVSASLGVLLMLLGLCSVLCEQMDWGDNPDLVDQSNPDQGREHVKLMVALVGDDIDLQCQVHLTSEPVSAISWEIDGHPENSQKEPVVTTKNGKVFIEENLKIPNITEEMDDKSVKCRYAKGQYTGSQEAILHVFKLEIEISKEVCDACEGDVKLVFKESVKSSPGEANVQEQIQSKITEMTSQTPQVDQAEYTLTLPFATVQANKQILAMRPTTFAQCKCESAEPEPETWYYWLIGIILGIVAICGGAFGIRQKTKNVSNVPGEDVDSASNL